MRFESQTHPQDDHIDRITDCSTRYGQAPAVCTRVSLAKGRCLERTWRRSRTHLDHSRYKHQCHLWNRMMTKAKSKYLADVIFENSHNPRRLWNSINNILLRSPPPALPELTNSHVFERASEDEIKKLILSSSSKSCDLDPIPTSVLKNCLDILITSITDIINISMETSTFTPNFKEAHVRPLLEKSYFPKNELKNYRPVSNLSFISKILEKILANRLQAHIKITIYLIHYNQPTGNIILQNRLYWKYIKVSLLVWTRVILRLWTCLTCRPLSTSLTMLH